MSKSFLIIQKYFNKEVLQTAIAILLLLIIVAILNQFTAILNKVAEGILTMHIVWPVLATSIPSLMSLLLPMAVFLALILVISRWYAENEIVILQITGYSYLKLLLLVLRSIWFIVLLAMLLNLWLAPLSARIRDNLLERPEKLQKAAWLIPRHFHIANNGKYVVYVDDSVAKTNVVNGVFVAKPLFDAKKQKWHIVLSASASERDQILTMTDGYSYEFDPHRLDWRIIKFHDYQMQIVLPDIASRLHTRSKPTMALWADGTNVDLAELNWRFAISLAPLFLSIVALPLSYIAPRHGRFVRILPAIIVFLVYYQMLTTTTHWLEHGIIPVGYGMWPVHAAMVLLAVCLHKWHQWKLR